MSKKNIIKNPVSLRFVSFAFIFVSRLGLTQTHVSIPRRPRRWNGKAAVLNGILSIDARRLKNIKIDYLQSTFRFFKNGRRSFSHRSLSVWAWFLRVR